MALPEAPAERHRVVAATFGDRVRGVPADGWDDPAPVAGWTARDVVEHLGWFPGYFQTTHGIDIAASTGAPEAPEDLAANWDTVSANLQRLLDDPATAERRVTDPHLGELPFAVLVDRIYVADVFMHTWDLARATGQDDRLDPAFCAELLAGMEPIADLLWSSGQYGPPVEVPADADSQTRLLGFIGRDPAWQPPADETD